MYVSHFCASLLIIYILVMHICKVIGASGSACLGLHAHSLFRGGHIQFALFFIAMQGYISSLDANLPLKQKVIPLNEIA